MSTTPGPARPPEYGPGASPLPSACPAWSTPRTCVPWSRATTPPAAPTCWPGGVGGASTCSTPLLGPQVRVPAVGTRSGRDRLASSPGPTPRRSPSLCRSWRTTPPSPVSRPRACAGGWARPASRWPVPPPHLDVVPGRSPPGPHRRAGGLGAEITRLEPSAPSPPAWSPTAASVTRPSGRPLGELRAGRGGGQPGSPRRSRLGARGGHAAGYPGGHGRGGDGRRRHPRRRRRRVLAASHADCEDWATASGLAGWPAGSSAARRCPGQRGDRPRPLLRRRRPVLLLLPPSRARHRGAGPGVDGRPGGRPSNRRVGGAGRALAVRAAAMSRFRDGRERRRNQFALEPTLGGVGVDRYGRRRACRPCRPPSITWGHLALRR